jgi:protein-disulfide isomerase
MTSFKKRLIDFLTKFMHYIQMFRGFSFKNVTQFFVPGLVIVAIGLAFFSGTLWQKVKLLEGGTVTPQGTDQGTQQPQAQLSIDTIKGLFDKNIIKFGDANRKVLFVEMADPSCPYCAAAAGKNHTIYKDLGATFQLVEDGGKYVSPTVEMKKLVDAGQASYVYIYYPGHGNGEMGMKALYCANEKGKFWEAHDLLMTASGYTLVNTTVQNDKTKSQVVADFFKSAVDPSFLKSCLDSGKYDAQLVSDQELATSLQMQGTPSFYVNTTNFPGAYSYTDMKSAVDSALK